jgi:hypothetical protein
MLNAMTQLALNRFDIPSAKHRNMQITPVLAVMLASWHLCSRLRSYSVPSHGTLPEDDGVETNH